MQGGSTRRGADLVHALGLGGISKRRVGRLCAERDPEVEWFRTRRLDGPYLLFWLDATFVKVREAGHAPDRPNLTGHQGVPCARIPSEAGQNRPCRSDDKIKRLISRRLDEIFVVGSFGRAPVTADVEPIDCIEDGLGVARVTQ